MFQILICLTLFWVHSNANQFSNPIALSAADPWMQYYKGYYYLTCTTAGDFVGIRKSKTLDGLRSAPNQVVYRFDGSNLWAPEFHLVNNKWYLYYTAGPRTTDLGQQRNHVAESVSDDPMGPYHFKANLDDPKDEGFELDPSLITIKGQLYLLGSYVKGTQNLYIRPMSNPFTPSGPKRFLSAPDLPWERQGNTVNEGPEPLYHNGRTFVVYSASFCGTPDYKLGLLEFVGTDPLNAAHWHKHPTPVFQRNDQNHVYGPGHNGFFKSPDGKEDWIVYHANDDPSFGCDGRRTSRAKKFTWNADGLPNFGTPDPINARLQAPSGE